ncbi:TetR/AcrR family transcriptional regulator [Actinoplanes sp. HUAS TT8]|uniref:TetR/AcrR family transcriptional regulator n=1 Tax=Actinoplanes sp. HUAS TT8 TaxID=3447453 RepID=UPI003F51FCA9
MAGRDDGVDSRRTDTRERALRVALGLFARQGYAGTSLREIAEQLGVTKAALYFHFRSKEEILTAILRGYLDGVNALVADSGGGQEKVLRGYAEHQRRWGLDLVLTVRQNFSEIQELPIGAEIRSGMRALIDVLAPAGADAAQRLRVRVALSAFQTAAVTGLTEDAADEDDLQEAALAIALDLLHGR